MKKLLILQMRPEDEAADSEFEAILRVGEINRENTDRIRLEIQDIPQIDLDNYSAIIAGGSPFDVSIPDDEKSVPQKQIESFYDSLFDEIIPLDFPFFGACSGNGLLGRYCGAKISGKYSEPVGPVDIQITDAGQQDPLLRGLPHSFTAFAGHKEACDEVPEGAALLATSESCPIQMFRIKNNIYATQFHPEADTKEFILRMDIYRNHGYFSPDELDKIKLSLKNVKTPYAEEILKRFVLKYSKHLFSEFKKFK